MNRHSDRWFLKYLVSDHGLCLGVELRDRSYLLILSSRGLAFRRRPRGDRVVEACGFDIRRIVLAVEDERGPAG